MDWFFVVAMLAVAFLMCRNVLAYRWALRACNEAYTLNMADIEAGTYVDGQWRYDQIPSHESMMFDLTQWSYRSPFANAEA